MLPPSVLPPAKPTVNQLNPSQGNKDQGRKMYLWKAAKKWYVFNMIVGGKWLANLSRLKIEIFV